MATSTLTLLIRARQAESVIRRLHVGLGKLDSKASLLQGRFGKLGKAITGLNVIFKSLVASGMTAIIAAAGDSVRNMAKYEKQLISVAKTTGTTGDQFDYLGQQFLKMSSVIPQSAEDLAGIAVVAGQLGIHSTDDILMFTDVIAKMGTATNLVGSEGAESLAKLLYVTGTAVHYIPNLGSAIVALGNNFATTESQIVHTATTIAQAGTAFGITAVQSVGLATAFSVVGLEAEISSGIVARVMGEMSNAVASGNEKLSKFAEIAGYTADEFRAKFGKDAVGAFIDFLEGMGKVEGGTTGVTSALKELGLQNIRVQRGVGALSQNIDILKSSLNTAEKSFRENIALEKEFSIAASSLISQLKLLRNASIRVGIALTKSNLYDYVKNVATRATDITINFADAIGVLANSFHVDLGNSIRESNSLIKRWATDNIMAMAHIAEAVGGLVDVYDILKNGIISLHIAVLNIVRGVNILTMGLQLLVRNSEGANKTFENFSKISSQIQEDYDKIIANSIDRSAEYKSKILEIAVAFRQQEYMSNVTTQSIRNLSIVEENLIRKKKELTNQFKLLGDVNGELSGKIVQLDNKLKIIRDAKMRWGASAAFVAKETAPIPPLLNEVGNSSDEAADGFDRLHEAAVRWENDALNQINYLQNIINHGRQYADVEKEVSDALSRSSVLSETAVRNTVRYIKELENQVDIIDRGIKSTNSYNKSISDEAVYLNAVINKGSVYADALREYISLKREYSNVTFDQVLSDKKRIKSLQETANELNNTKKVVWDFSNSIREALSSTIYENLFGYREKKKEARDYYKSVQEEIQKTYQEDLRKAGDNINKKKEANKKYYEALKDAHEDYLNKVQEASDARWKSIWKNLVKSFQQEFVRGITDAVMECIIDEDFFKKVICKSAGKGFIGAIKNTVIGGLKSVATKIGGWFVQTKVGSAIASAAKAVAEKFGITFGSTIVSSGGQVATATASAVKSAGAAASAAASSAGAEAAGAYSSGFMSETAVSAKIAGQQAVQNTASGMVVAAPYMGAAAVAVAAYFGRKHMAALREHRRDLRDEYKSYLQEGMILPTKQVAQDLGNVWAEVSKDGSRAWLRIGNIATGAVEEMKRSFASLGIHMDFITQKNGQGFYRLTGQIQNMGEAMRAVKQDAAIMAHEIKNAVQSAYSGGDSDRDENAPSRLQSKIDFVKQNYFDLAAYIKQRMSEIKVSTSELADMLKDGVLTAAEASKAGIKNWSGGLVADMKVVKSAVNDVSTEIEGRVGDAFGSATTSSKDWSRLTSRELDELKKKFAFAGKSLRDSMVEAAKKAGYSIVDLKNAGEGSFRAIAKAIGVSVSAVKDLIDQLNHIPREVKTRHVMVTEKYAGERATGTHGMWERVPGNAGEPVVYTLHGGEEVMVRSRNEVHNHQEINVNQDEVVGVIERLHMDLLSLLDTSTGNSNGSYNLRLV